MYVTTKVAQNFQIKGGQTVISFRIAASYQNYVQSRVLQKGGNHL